MSTSISVDGTFGCLFFAAIFSSVLWGVSSIQVYLYYETHGSTDRLWLKVYVFVAWALDTIHQIFLLDAVYIYLVTDIGDLIAVTVLQSSLQNTAILIGLLILQIQLLFILRVWELSRSKKVLVSCLTALVLSSFSTLIVYYFALNESRDAVNPSSQALTVMRVVVSSFVLTDTTLSGTIVFQLHRRKAGFKGTNTIVNRLMTYIIGTGLITSALAIFGLAANVALPHLYLDVSSLEIMPKLYFNCILTSLNLRNHLRETSTQNSVQRELSEGKPEPESHIVCNHSEC